MTKSKPKLILSNTRLIPFNKLVLSQANVRRVSNGVLIEDLAEDITARRLSFKCAQLDEHIAAPRSISSSWG